MILTIALILPILFVIFNSILFYFIIYESDKNILLINLIVIIILVFFNIKIAFEYLFLVFIFIILFIA